MLIQELFNIPVNEAISVSHYASEVKTAIRDGIADSISRNSPLSRDFGEWTHRNIVPTTLIDKFKVLKKYDDPALYFSQYLSINIQQALNTELKRDKVKYGNSSKIVGGVLFQDPLSNEAGHAAGNVIVLNKKAYLDPLAEKILTEIQQQLFDNNIVHEPSPDDDDISDQVRRNTGIWYRVDWEEARMHLVSNRYEIADKVMVRTPQINNLVDTILHELVHVIQHQQQRHRSQPEYRSYLDKKGNKLISYWRPEEGWDFDNTNWQRLYYASPQEIPAFAHNMAGKIIRSFGFDEPLEEPYPTVTAADFVRELRNIIGDQYRNPTTPKESKILNRYLKLAYQEVQRYIERKKAADKANQPSAESSSES